MLNPSIKFCCKFLPIIPCYKSGVSFKTYVLEPVRFEQAVDSSSHGVFLKPCKIDFVPYALNFGRARKHDRGTIFIESRYSSFRLQYSQEFLCKCFRFNACRWGRVLNEVRIPPIAENKVKSGICDWKLASWSCKLHCYIGKSHICSQGDKRADVYLACVHKRDLSLIHEFCKRNWDKNVGSRKKEYIIALFDPENCPDFLIGFHQVFLLASDLEVSDVCSHPRTCSLKILTCLEPKEV